MYSISSFKTSVSRAAKKVNAGIFQGALIVIRLLTRETSCSYLEEKNGIKKAYRLYR